MSADPRLSTGERIAAFRRLNRWTQVGLSKQAKVSYSLLTKVESGAKPASPALLTACARAMSIPVTYLTGQPFTQDQTEDQLDAPLATLRASLENWDLELEGLPTRSLGDITSDVAVLGESRRAANWRQVAIQAPALIDELVQLTQTTTGQAAAAAHFQLMQVYRAAHHVAHGLGLLDLASLILARMEHSANGADDPYMVALYRYTRAYSTFTTGRLDVGQKIIKTAREDIEAGVRAGDVAALCAAGSLHLRGAMLATRQGDSDTAHGQLELARNLATTLGTEVIAGVNAHDTIQSFGPTNVAIHASAVEMELGNHAKAVLVAAEVRPPNGYPAERVGHHFIDLSRAQFWTDDREGAMKSLIKARNLAPQKTKYHPTVRETVAGLVHASRSTADNLIGYATWVGVQL